MLKGEVKDVLLLDVTPLSLGIETKGGVMTKLIERNTTIPTRRTEVFTTAEDMQPSVEIHVLQGEREMASYNKTLGKFQLVDLPPAPRGVPQIEVTFDIDANGIVHVSAKDRATSKEQSMTITGQSSLNKDDIDRMVKDAEAHAEEDRQRREEAEVRNNADTLVYQTEKVLREQGDKVSADERAAVEGPLDDLKKALAGTDVEAIKAATEKPDGRQPELQPEALRGRRPRRQRRRHVGLGPEPTAAGADDDEIVDAEIVDDERVGASRCPTTARSGRRRQATPPRRTRPSPSDAASRRPTSSTTSTALVGRARPVQGHRPAPPGRLRELPQAGRPSRSADEVDRATGRLVEELLPVLDACEAAFAHGVDGDRADLVGAARRAAASQGLEAMDPRASRSTRPSTRP